MAWQYDQPGILYDQPGVEYNGGVFGAVIDYIIKFRRRRRS